MLELASQLISIYQALQLVGLAPCLFVIFFLIVMSFRNAQAFVPLCYFMALACSFILPLLDLSIALEKIQWLNGMLLLGQSTLVACCFLLIMQFMLGKVPPPKYWLVLLVPMLGGGFIIYAGQIAEPEQCDIAIGCLNEHSIKLFYNLFSSSLVFLLLVYYAWRLGFSQTDSEIKRHKYWLAIVLILLHLALLALDLLLIGGAIVVLQSAFAATIIKLSFIYLVLTSLFRVYYPVMMQEALVAYHTPIKHDEAADKALLARLENLLNEQHIYREMRLNRAALAEKLDVTENTLSRIINSYLSKSFNELINHHRIEDAKRRLASEKTAITTIGFEVGFNSIASFNRVFREQVGMSPSQYRESNSLS